MPQRGKGISTGVDISFELKNTILPASYNQMKIATFLIFPSKDKTNEDTIDILENNNYYEPN